MTQYLFFFFFFFFLIAGQVRGSPLPLSRNDFRRAVHGIPKKNKHLIEVKLVECFFAVSPSCTCSQGGCRSSSQHQSCHRAMQTRMKSNPSSIAMLLQLLRQLRPRDSMFIQLQYIYGRPLSESGYVFQLMRAAVELAKAWRTDKFLRRLDVSLPTYQPTYLPTYLPTNLTT